MKNKAFINQMKLLHHTIDQVTPQVYACFALTLYRKYGWRYKRINDLFLETQELWQENVNLNINMVDQCFQETGIDVTSRISSRNGDE